MSIPEKGKSSLDRVVGGSAKQQADLEKRLQGRFADQRWSRNLAEAEREKTAVEREAIRAANRELTELRAKYGLPDREIPEQNVHALRHIPETVAHLLESGRHGHFDYENQRVLFLEQASRLE